MLKQKSAIQKINAHGILLVFPILNSRQPPSLWFEFHPRTKMRWEWDDEGDNKVLDMWTLMKRLSENRNVVYSKWFQGRATFFSRPLFSAMLTVLKNQGALESSLSHTSQNLLEILNCDSPLSTKQLKKLAELQGKDNEGLYTKALKDLFAKQLIVACGEVNDGAFPSLAIGSTQLIYEDLWKDSESASLSKAQNTVDQFLQHESKVRLYFDKTLKSLNAN
jgi:hypothetical protein